MRPRTVGAALALCIAAHVGLAAPLLVQDSLTADEPVHIAAAYLCVKDRDLRLNREHPPLAKALAGVGMLAGDFVFPYDSPGYAKAEQYEAAQEFIFGGRNDADSLILHARLPLFLLSGLFLVFLFRFAKQLFGDRAALLTCLLYAFCPIVLAHSHLVTTDAPLMVFSFAGVGLSALALGRRSYGYAIVSGIALGLALLAKFSGLLAPAFAGGLGIAALATGKGHRWRLVGLTTCILTLCLTTLLWGCWLFGAHTPGGEGPLWTYWDGLDMVRKHVARGHWKPQFLLGQYSFEGWWYYFPVALVLKTSVFLQALLLLSMAQVFQRSRAGESPIPESPGGAGATTPAAPREPACGCQARHRVQAGRSTKIPVEGRESCGLVYHSLWAFPVFYLLASMRSSLNIGVRHLMPILPFLYVFVGVQVDRLLRAYPKRLPPARGERWPQALPEDPGAPCPPVPPEPPTMAAHETPEMRAGPGPEPERGLPRPRRRQVAVLLLLAGYALSTIASWPTYLGFFTEWARRHPERLLNDSNLDWGQDLLRLEKYLQGHGISRIRLDYFGPRGAPGYYFRERFEPWTVDRGAPGQGWFGVSEFYIMTSRYYKGHGTSRYSYEFLDAFRPAARIGSSIRLYQLQNGQGLAPP